MKSFDYVTQIGDTTPGDFENTGNRSFSPNGWNFNYPVQLFLRPYGEYLDGKGGNVPDIYVKNSKTDILSNQNKVIEKAIQPALFTTTPKIIAHHTLYQVFTC